MPSAETVYDRIRKAYDQQDYRGALTLLDKNWGDLERYGRLHGIYEQLIDLRQICRDRVIERQSRPPLNPSAPRRTDRKLSRIKHRRR